MNKNNNKKSFSFYIVFSLIILIMICSVLGAISFFSNFSFFTASAESIDYSTGYEQGFRDGFSQGSNSVNTADISFSNANAYLRTRRSTSSGLAYSQLPIRIFSDSGYFSFNNLDFYKSEELNDYPGAILYSVILNFSSNSYLVINSVDDLSFRGFGNNIYLSVKLVDYTSRFPCYVNNGVLGGSTSDLQVIFGNPIESLEILFGNRLDSNIVSPTGAYDDYISNISGISSNSSSMNYSKGYSDGLRTGRVSGYDEGYANGLANTSDYSFTGLLGAVFDVPVNAFTSLFNFEFLGVNLKDFFLAIITIMIGVSVIKLIP